MRTVRVVVATLAMALAIAPFAYSQSSDFQVKKSFEEKAGALAKSIADAKSTTELDELAPKIDALEKEFAPRKEFLAKALHPQSLDSVIGKLREDRKVASEKLAVIEQQASTITTQEGEIATLEEKVRVLVVQIDGLNAEQKKLIAEIDKLKAANADLKQTIEKLRANIEAKDKLIFNLVESVLEPFGKDLSRISDVEKQGLGQKLQQANVIERINSVALENLVYVEKTPFQAEDFPKLLEEQKSFASRWNRVRSDMVAAVNSYQTKVGGTAASPNVGGQVDTAITTWAQKIRTRLWTELGNEFSSRQVAIDAFTDGPTFATAVRALVEKYRTGKEEYRPFVNEIWKKRIAGPWRETLSRDDFLGATEMGALDQLVTQLDKEKSWARTRFIGLCVLGVIALALIVAFVVKRKKEPKPAPVNPFGS